MTFEILLFVFSKFEQLGYDISSYSAIFYYVLHTRCTVYYYVSVLVCNIIGMNKEYEKNALSYVYAPQSF